MRVWPATQRCLYRPPTATRRCGCRRPWLWRRSASSMRRKKRLPRAGRHPVSGQACRARHWRRAAGFPVLHRAVCQAGHHGLHRRWLAHALQPGSTAQARPPAAPHPRAVCADRPVQALRHPFRATFAETRRAGSARHALPGRQAGRFFSGFPVSRWAHFFPHTVAPAPCRTACCRPPHRLWRLHRLKKRRACCRYCRKEWVTGSCWTPLSVC